MALLHKKSPGASQQPGSRSYVARGSSETGFGDAHKQRFGIVKIGTRSNSRLAHGLPVGDPHHMTGRKAPQRVGNRGP